MQFVQISPVHTTANAKADIQEMGSIAQVQVFSQLGRRILIDSLYHMGLAVNQEYLE
jgi:hypothetical protein